MVSKFNTLSNNKCLFFQISIFQTPFTQAKNPDNINELWGLSLSNLPKASLVEKREPKDHLDTKIVDYVSNFNSEMENVRTFLSSIGIPLNDNYELPVKEFTTEYLKSIFNEEEYEIREFDDFMAFSNTFIFLMFSLSYSFG